MTIYFPPHPFGSEVTFEQILFETQKMHSWEDKYRYLIMLGKHLPALSDEQRSHCESIYGCESQIWLHWELQNGSLQFAADSDSRIVKGLLALILVLTHNQTPEHIQKINFQTHFESLQLLNHLSESRNNGLQIIIKKICSLDH